MTEYLVSLDYVENTPEFNALMNAGSVLVGAVVGGAVGGNLQAAAGGGSIALIADINNRQLHEPQYKAIRKLSKGDPKEEARYVAAGCALQHCSAEFAKGTQEYEYWKAIEDLGNDPSLKDYRDELRTGSSKSLFAYGILDWGTDKAKAIANTADKKLDDALTNAGEGLALLRTLDPERSKRYSPVVVDEETPSTMGDLNPALKDARDNLLDLGQHTGQAISDASDFYLAAGITKGAASILGAAAIKGGERLVVREVAGGASIGTNVVRGMPKNLEGLVDSDSIRFTQDSIKGTFRDGGSMQVTIDALRSGRLSPNDLPPIRVFEQDGLVYTLDNRRLFVAHQAEVPIKIVPATPAEVANEIGYKMTTPNGGKIICLRNGCVQ